MDQTLDETPNPTRNAADAPDGATLAAIGVDPATIQRAQPMAGGLSGSRLTRLTLRLPVAPSRAAPARPPGAAPTPPADAPATFEARRVVKRVAARGGWLGVASEDARVREVALHTSGTLARLPATITTGARAAGYLASPLSAATPAGEPPAQIEGALLLRDERSRLLARPMRAPGGRLPVDVAALLDRLAALHARYWNDPRLRDPALGLAPPRAALLLVAPAVVAERLAAGDSNPYLPLAVTGWEAFWRLAPAADAATLRVALAHPEPYVSLIERGPLTLTHGDVWGPNLGWLPATRRAPHVGRRLLLLDWALATAGPATYDPLWLAATWSALDPVRLLAAYRARLERRLAARGVTLAPDVWLRLANLGYLRTTLTCGEALGRAALDRPADAAARARAGWWARRAARAARCLSPHLTDI